MKEDLGLRKSEARHEHEALATEGPFSQVSMSGKEVDWEEELAVQALLYQFELH